MNVVDSSGWLEYFINGQNAAFFAPIIEKAAAEVLVPTISLFEVFKRVLIEKNRDDALEAIALMKEGRVVDLDEDLALSAAEFSWEFKIPMADSIILATARAFNATLWSQDAHYKKFQGVQYMRNEHDHRQCLPGWSSLPLRWGRKPCEKVIRLVVQGRPSRSVRNNWAACPLQASAEIIGNRVIRKDGVDVTEAFNRGAP